jgi:hypothetical protein
VGRLLIGAGIVLVVAGLVVIGAERLGIRLGSLVSAILSLIAWLFNRR